MSQASFEISATPRALVGKGASRRLRRTEQVPAILYGAKDEPMMLSLLHRHVKKALENEAFYSHILTLDVEGKKYQAVLKDLQRHPYKPQIMHMDFQRVSATEKLTMHVPLHFINEADAPGVQEGGLLSKHFVELEIRCLPANLPEYIEVDVGQLALNAAIHLTEIKLPQGIEIVALSHGHDHAHDAAVVSIHLPRQEKEETTEEAASGEEGAEPADKSADKGN